MASLYIDEPRHYTLGFYFSRPMLPVGYFHDKLF